MGILKPKLKKRDIWSSIERGNKVQLALRDAEGEKYMSTVLERSDFHIYIKTPVTGKAYLDFSQNMPAGVAVEVYNPRRGKIKFTSKIVGQEWLKDNRIKIAYPNKIRCIQLRRHYRIEVALPAVFSLIDKEKIAGDLSVSEPGLSAVCENISEGGALMVLNKLISMQVGSYLNIKIKLPPNFTIRVRGEVIHIELARGKCGLGVEWVSMESKGRELLRRFIFSELGKDML